MVASPRTTMTYAEYLAAEERSSMGGSPVQSSPRSLKLCAASLASS